MGPVLLISNLAAGKADDEQLERALSVLRAYTRREMADLAQEAGLRPIRWESFAVYRVALTAVPIQS